MLASVAAGAWMRGDLDEAEAAAEAAQDAARGLDPITGRRAVEALADAAICRGNLERSIELFREAYEQARAAGDPFQMIWDLGSVAAVLAYVGRPEEALPVA